MWSYIFWCFVLAIVTDIAQCKNCKIDHIYLDHDGWLRKHDTPATFAEAVRTCQRNGAEVASPVDSELLQKLRSLMDDSFSYYIGTNTTINMQQLVSMTDNATLETMPVQNMIQNLDKHVCLKMNSASINTVTCSTKLPFICYSNGYSQSNTQCGPSDSGYQFVATTGSCYKVHEEVHLNWADANALCNFEGGHLAVPNNREEMRVIKSMYPKVHLSGSFWDPLLIGVRNWSDKGNDMWLSIHGECLDWEWEPTGNNPNVLYPPQNCAAMIPSGTIDNMYCDNKSYFICEKKPQSASFEGGFTFD